MFSSNEGSFVGQVASGDLAEGQCCSIEFEIPTECVDAATLVNERSFSLSHSNGINRFTGEIEAVDDDIAYFRLSDSSLIMLDFQVAELREGQWIALEVPEESLEVFCYDVEK